MTFFKIYTLIIKLIYISLLIINSIPGLTNILIILISLFFFKSIRDYMKKNWLRISSSTLIILFSNEQLINTLSQKAETQLIISLVVVVLGGICAYSYYHINYVKLDLSKINTGLDFKILTRNIQHPTSYASWMRLMRWQNANPGLKLYNRANQRIFCNSLAVCIATMGICYTDPSGYHIPAILHTQDLILFIWQADLTSGGFIVVSDFVRLVADNYLQLKLNPAANLNQLYDQLVFVNNNMQETFRTIIEKYEADDQYGIMYDKIDILKQERISKAYDILIDR